MSRNDCNCDCAEVYASVYELVYGRCDESRRAALVAHIDNCPGCLEKLGIEKQVARLIKRSCCEPAPAHLKERIVVRLRVHTTTIRHSRD
ncbi:mycothiol system anti-sigma-R factor [Corynebacterium mendelii]|uniref:Mycothiol system anti-sigma-R factor n=1 Tax=Corynebacterium mendelii TaxID=2765362 RepID=A0A939E101_9CORY|nr:mycothiol system anti-sigma-R factor [Corynebacterium mendelii]MBN9644456.1 mycothiol system anti-sigma-R factor [Corynebacterium mendelii]